MAWILALIPSAKSKLGQYTKLMSYYVIKSTNKIFLCDKLWFSVVMTNSKWATLALPGAEIFMGGTIYHHPSRATQNNLYPGTDRVKSSQILCSSSLYLWSWKVTSNTFHDSIALYINVQIQLMQTQSL